jgi:hypothetical protein
VTSDRCRKRPWLRLPSGSSYSSRPSSEWGSPNGEDGCRSGRSRRWRPRRAAASPGRGRPPPLDRPLVSGRRCGRSPVGADRNSCRTACRGRRRGCVGWGRSGSATEIMRVSNRPGVMTNSVIGRRAPSPGRRRDNRGPSSYLRPLHRPFVLVGALVGTVL